MQSGAAGEFSASHNTRCPSLARNPDRSWYPVHVQTDRDWGRGTQLVIVKVRARDTWGTSLGAIGSKYCSQRMRF